MWGTELVLIWTTVIVDSREKKERESRGWGIFVEGMGFDIYCVVICRASELLSCMLFFFSYWISFCSVSVFVLEPMELGILFRAASTRAKDGWMDIDGGSGGRGGLAQRSRSRS